MIKIREKDPNYVEPYKYDGRIGRGIMEQMEEANQFTYAQFSIDDLDKLLTSHAVPLEQQLKKFEAAKIKYK